MTTRAHRENRKLQNSLRRAARGEMEGQATNILAKIDPYREIEIFPSGTGEWSDAAEAAWREDRRGLHRRDMRARGEGSHSQVGFDLNRRAGAGLVHLEARERSRHQGQVCCGAAVFSRQHGGCHDRRSRRIEGKVRGCSLRITLVTRKELLRALQQSSGFMKRPRCQRPDKTQSVGPAGAVRDGRARPTIAQRGR